jgi:hypothetical protein
MSVNVRRLLAGSGSPAVFENTTARAFETPVPKRSPRVIDGNSEYENEPPM